MKMINVLNCIEKTINVVCQLLLLTLFIFAILQVFCRYVLLVAIPWMDEIMRYLLVWLAYLGIAICVRRSRHIMLDFVQNRSPKIVKYIMIIVSRIAIIVFFLLVLVLGSKLAVSLTQQTFISLNVSMVWVFIAIPVSSLISILFILEDVYLIIRNKKVNENISETAV